MAHSLSFCRANSTGALEWSLAAGYVRDSFRRSGMYGRISVLTPGNATPIPLDDSLSNSVHQAAWSAIKTSSASQKTLLSDLLRTAMERHGFTVEPNEWWHFNYKDWKEYPILDIAFSEIR